MKAKRIVSGLLLGAAGCIFILVAVFVAQAAQDQTRLTEQTYRAADGVCREQMQKIGTVKEVDGGRIFELTVPVVVDKRTALGDASAAIAACPTRNLQSFCLGSGCNDPEGSRPVATQARRPSSMIMRMAIRPGAAVAAAAPAGSPATARPTVVRPAPHPGAVQQPARPQPARPQPARPAPQSHQNVPPAR